MIRGLALLLVLATLCSAQPSGMIGKWWPSILSRLKNCILH
jgi:hypothetical protein